MNIAFFSSSPLALPLLTKLVGEFNVRLVVTSPDKPVGRKQDIVPSILKSYAIKNKIECLTPSTLKDDAGVQFAALLKSRKIDLIIVIDYVLLIRKIVFETPKYKTINIHFSKLPKYRGPHPDAFAILNGDKTTAISYVLIDSGYDTGNILAKQEVEIVPSETAGELHAGLYKICEKSVAYIINSWANWNLGIKNDQLTINNEQITIYLPPKNQDHSAATSTKLLSREDGFINWKILNNLLKNQPVNPDELPDLIKNYYENFSSKHNNIYHLSFIIYHFFLALSPWPGMWTEVSILPMTNTTNDPLDSPLENQLPIKKRLKILKAHLEKEEFVIDEVQLEGKKLVNWKQFCEAYKI